MTMTVNLVVDSVRQVSSVVLHGLEICMLIALLDYIIADLFDIG